MTQQVVPEFKDSSICSGGDRVAVGMLLGVPCRCAAPQTAAANRGSARRSGRPSWQVEHIQWMARPVRNQDAREEDYDSMTLRSIERRKHEEAPPEG